MIMPINSASVVAQLRGLLSSPEVIVATWRSARKDLKGLREQDARERLVQIEPLWDKLFPVEQARIVQLLVEGIDLTSAGLDLSPRIKGLSSFVSELHSGNKQHTRADVLKVHMPFTTRKRGGRKLIVRPDGLEWSARSDASSSLTKAVVRAFVSDGFWKSASTRQPMRSPKRKA